MFESFVGQENHVLLGFNENCKGTKICFKWYTWNWKNEYAKKNLNLWKPIKTASTVEEKLVYLQHLLYKTSSLPWFTSKTDLLKGINQIKLVRN